VSPVYVHGLRASGRSGADIAKLELVAQSCFGRYTHDRYRRYSAQLSSFLRALRVTRCARDLGQA